MSGDPRIPAVLERMKDQGWVFTPSAAQVADLLAAADGAAAEAAEIEGRDQYDAYVDRRMGYST